MIFNLELGQVPTINKETLSRKVTMALSEKAKGGDHDYNINDAEDTIDDVLSCAKLEFLGAGSKNFFKSRDATDKRNNKFCTMPVRLDFKDKEPRIQAEIAMRKLCQVSCSTPYPKKLRNIDKLTIDVHAKVDNQWQDLNLSCNIPTTILDNFTDALDSMDEGETAPLS